MPHSTLNSQLTRNSVYLWYSLNGGTDYLSLAETIAYKGFEEDALDTWNYTASTIGSGYWGIHGY